MIRDITALALTAMLATSVTAATIPVCSSAIYAVFQPLSTLSAAQAFCTSKYPVAPVITTATITQYATETSTSIVLATTTSTVSDTFFETQYTTSTDVVTESTFVATFSTNEVYFPTVAPNQKRAAVPAVKASSTATALPILLSLLQAKASAFVSTACSCIEKPVTKTVSTTKTISQTLGATATSTVVSYETTIITVPVLSTIVEPSTTTVAATFSTTNTITDCGNVPSATPACFSPQNCYQADPNGNQCICIQRAEGGSACVDIRSGCRSRCNVDTDCEAGAYCADSCCGKTCLAYINSCNNPMAPSRLFRPRAVGAARAAAEPMKRDACVDRPVILPDSCRQS